MSKSLISGFQIYPGYEGNTIRYKMIIFKTTDQVRGFYYLIWFQKVSKYVQSSCFPEKLPDQELYAMIAYGELRRKLKVEPSPEILELKFGELLKTQHTCVEFKGQSK